MLEKVIYSTQTFNFTFLLFIRAIFFFFFFEGFVMTAVFFQPKVVTETDEAELTKELARLEQMNAEVDGDDDDSEDEEGSSEEEEAAPA